MGSVKRQWFGALAAAEWTAGPDPELDHYEIRGVAGPDYYCRQESNPTSMPAADLPWRRRDLLPFSPISPHAPPTTIHPRLYRVADDLWVVVCIR